MGTKRIDRETAEALYHMGVPLLVRFDEWDKKCPCWNIHEEGWLDPRRTADHDLVKVSRVNGATCPEADCREHHDLPKWVNVWVSCDEEETDRS